MAADRQMRFLGSQVFWLAMLAAPCVWLVLWWGFSLPVTFAASVAWPALLTSILVYPVLEEIVFRGALQGWLMSFIAGRKSLLGVSLANLGASCVFTALHFINHSPGWALLVFVPSLVFGWARDRFDSILPAIALHVFYNAGFILLFG